MATAKMWAMATATRVADDEGVRERRPTTSMTMTTMTTTTMMMTMATTMTTMTMTTAVAATTTVTAADDDDDDDDDGDDDCDGESDGDGDGDGDGNGNGERRWGRGSYLSSVVIISIKHFIFIIFNYQLHFSPWQGRDDRRAAIPFVLKKHASLRRVAGNWIATKNTGDLRKRPVVSSGMPYHVARDKANAAAIDPVRYPNCCDHRLLFPLNHQLYLTEAHHNVLLQHLAANIVLLARAALATHLSPYDLDDNTTRMEGLAKRKGHGRHSGRGNEDGG